MQGGLPEALAIIERHAAAGNAEALVSLGDMYWRGFGVHQDFDRARELFRAVVGRGLSDG